MEVTYVDISTWPRKVAGDLTFALRFNIAIYALAICVSSLVFAVMVLVDDSTLRQQGTLDPVPLRLRLMVAAALSLPTLIPMLGAGWWYRSRRSEAVNFGEKVTTVGRELRTLRWRLDRMAGYPRARKLTVGRLLLFLAPALAFGTLIYAGPAKQSLLGNRSIVLMAGFVVAIAAGIAGMRVLRPRRRESHAVIRSWTLRLGGLLLLLGTAWTSILIFGLVKEHTGAIGRFCCRTGLRLGTNRDSIG